ncbi:MAG TPA: PIN domain-containing protein [Tepidisphaeraceae bacterium]|nr:PIN domain-containing protein [Tepidisphaeraceae bacterium]
MIILDTNVLSEQIKLQPDATVARWAAGIPIGELFTTTLTEAEMLVGMEIMPAGRRRSALAGELTRLFGQNFFGRILSFDSAAARALSTMRLRRDRVGAPVLDADAMIAAIARAYGATVATRDIKDFAGFDIEIVNPWTFAG